MLISSPSPLVCRDHVLSQCLRYAVHTHLPCSSDSLMYIPCSIYCQLSWLCSEAGAPAQAVHHAAWQTYESHSLHDKKRLRLAMQTCHYIVEAQQ